MPETIALRDNLREALEQTANGGSRSLSDLVNEAVEEYVYRLQREKIDVEVAAYERMHEVLKTQYLGDWVAIHNQNLVDHDRDGEALYARVREMFGRTSVLIRRVTEQPFDELRIRTPSTGKIVG
jgi:predicted transcriptional regulator